MPDPFFIVGAPRSGTTLLRNLLRCHPDLECPEETFFYRWSDAFGSKAFNHIYLQNPTVLRHRKLDGIGDKEFWELFHRSFTRRQLQINYMQAYLAKTGNPNATWFDKTPQNIQRLHQVLFDFPESKILLVVRHPLNVISSIMMGRSVGPENFKGALNIWLEAAAAGFQLRSLFPGRVDVARYETLMEDPEGELERIVSFVGCERMESFPDIPITPAPDRFIGYLSPPQVDCVMAVCQNLLKIFHYPLELSDEQKEACESVRKQIDEEGQESKV